jgi:hypothetical protein
MAIEQHVPGTVTFTVTADAAAKFRKGESIDCEIEGRRVTGAVTKVEIGNRFGIVVVKLEAVP